jgi:heat shock protein 4
MLSPVFRVRDFHMHDITPYPIKVQWPATPTEPDDDTELVVFPRGNTIPSTKVLTFYRKEPFEIEATYAEPEGLPGSINPWIAKFSAKSVPADPAGDLACVKLKTRLNLHGVLSFEGAYVEEMVDREEQPMEVDGAVEGAPPPAPKKKKTKKEVPFVASTSSLNSTALEKLKEQEAQMHAADKLVMDTEDRKNALEEYVYDMRAKLDDRYAPYVQPEEKQKLLVALSEAEDWLYSDEGEDATKSAYVTRLDALKGIGDLITSRYRESEERPRVISQLRETLNKYMSDATSAHERFAHIDAKDKQSVVEKCATTQKWLDDQTVRQAERPKNTDPVLVSQDVEKKREEVVYFATPILTKPKPKPPVPTPTGTGANTPKSRTDTPDPAAAGGAKTEGEAPGPSEMDVD